MTKTCPSHWPQFLALTLCLIFSAGCTNASKARRRLAAADLDFQAQKYDDAELEYESVQRLSPGNPTAIRQLGFIYFEEGRRKALRFLQAALDNDPKNAEIQLKLAEIFIENRDLKKGVELLESVLQADPINEHALTLLVQTCPANELSSLGQRLETQLREGGQGAAACHTALGWIDLRMRKLSEADSEFQQALTLNPKLPSSYLGKATLCSIRKDTKGFTEAFKTAAELSPIRSKIRLNYAELKMQVGADDEAKEIVLDMTKKAPDYLPAWLFLMKTAFEEHKYDECKATIDRVLARDNLNFEAMLQLGTLALAQRDGPKAVTALQHMNEVYSMAPQVKYTLAQAYLMNNEKEKARGILKKALDLDRDYSPAVKLLANLDLGSDKYSESATLLSESIKTHPDDLQAQIELAETYLKQNQLERAMDVYQKMAPKFPQNAEIPYLMAMIYARQGDRAKMRLALDTSLELNPGYIPALKLINNLDIVEKHYPEAHNRLDRIIKNYPKAGEPLIMQGDIYWEEGQTNKAESAYAKAIELNPELSEAYLDLAKIYRESHHEQQAIDRLEALVAKHTNDVLTLRQIGIIHQEAGRYDLARVAYEKVLTVDSNDFMTLDNLAYVDSEYLGKLDQALELAARAKRLHPDDPVTADTLGWILFKKHEYGRALSSLQQSADQQPNNAETQVHLGMTYYMLGQEKSARVCLQQAVASEAIFPDKDLARRHLEILDIDPAKATPEVVRKLQSLVHEDPKDPVPWSRLAAIQEQHGEAQKAADSLKTILSINSQDWSAMVRLARLYADTLKDPRQALDLAKSAHNLAPDDSSASALLGELVYRSGDYPWALSLLEEAAHRSSDQPSLSYHLALAYYATGRTAEADEAMLKVVQQGGSPPDLDQAKQFLAMRAAVKDPAQAQASSAQVQQILAKDTNYVPALMVSALLAERKGAVDEAVQTYQKVLSNYPLFTPATRQLAILYSHSQRPGDLDKAYELAGKARAALPDDLELAKTLGVLAYHRGDYQKSMLLLREYTDKSGDDGEAFYDLGMDYYKLKQSNYTNLCKQALNRALDLHVSDALAGKAQGILKQLK